MLTCGAKNLMNEMSDDAFARGACDADELHVADGVTVIAREEFGVCALAFLLECEFFVHSDSVLLSVL